MKHWLVVYDRSTQELLRCEEFADSAAALAERFGVERERPGLEVVVLGADSLESVRKTHGRYFTGTDQGREHSSSPPPAGTGVTSASTK